MQAISARREVDAMESRIERLERITMKTKLGTLIIREYHLGDCPSAYDQDIYTPITDQKEMKELDLIR